MAFTLFDFKRLITPIKRKIFLLIGRAILTTVTNGGKTQLIQVTGLKDETISDIERMQPYGLDSYPAANMEAVILFQNGDRSHGIGIMVSDRENRPTDLVEGDVRLWDTRDNKITLKTDQIKVEGELLNMFAADKSYVLGEDLNTFLTNFVTWANTHTHSYLPGPGGATPTAVAIPIATNPSGLLSTKIKGE